jgi:AcrR family transcriptional regulator
MQTAGRRRRYAPRLPPEERREQLLDVTLKLIVSNGYGAVSMEAVAREAGITKPVVYDAFGNRGELLRALLEREEQRALSALGAVLPLPTGDADPDEVIVEGIEAFLHAVAADENSWRVILLPAEGTPDVVREHVDAGRRSVSHRLRDLVAWGIEQRGGPEGIDVELVADSILVLGERAAQLVLTEPDRYPPERFATFVRGLVSLLPRVG